MRRTSRVLSIVLVVILICMLPLDVDAKGGKKKTTAKTLDSSFATAAICQLVDGNTVSYAAALPSVPASDDGIIYLYQLATYEYSIPATAPIGTAPVSLNPSFTFALNHKTANTRLYSKFVIAVKVGGVMTPIANPQYIVNPEVLATHTHARYPHAKKGLQGPDFMNVLMNQQTQILASRLPRTAQIINNGADQAMTNPYSRLQVIGTDPKPVPANYYMLNAADASGVNLLINKMEYYGQTADKTDNWIIGNEVNVRQWNYMIFTSWDEYMRQYEQVFRICYTAIKSNNANAQVFICLDQNWDRNRPASHAEYYEYMDGKDFLDKFAADISATGNINWGVAQHPYTVPLFYAKFWDMSGCPDGAYCASMVNQNKMLSFQNISVLTNYLVTNPALLSPSGTVRPVILSEIGVSNAQGGQVQAATICSAYVAAASNPYIEQIIFSSANHGTFDSTFTPEAQDMYNNMDGANAQAYWNNALAIMGKASFSQVIR